MDDIQLGPMVTGEERQIAKMLSIAMLDNPIHVSALGGRGEAERQHLELMLLDDFADESSEVIVAKHAGEIVGALRSYKCHGTQSPDESASDQPEQNTTDLKDMEARLTRWYSFWEARDPQEPHRHLGPVGVQPDYQGRGIGSKMMMEFCARVDAGREPAYLETDLAANVRFYERFGFRVTDEATLMGVKNTFMWRPAQK